ncbi:MAG: hypothetical protein Q9160_007817 [Pyrenula sp. 1 TL-2023]
MASTHDNTIPANPPPPIQQPPVLIRPNADKPMGSRDISSVYGDEKPSSSKDDCSLYEVEKLPSAHIRDSAYSGSPPSIESAETIDEKYLPVLPEKKYGRAIRHLRWTIASIYRLLFSIVFLGNAAALLALTIGNGSLIEIPLDNILTAVACNICAAIMMRQEMTINALFLVFGKIPLWVPLPLRCMAARIYHFGGIHSGCGFAATAWFVIFNALMIRHWDVNDLPKFRSHPEILGLTCTLDFLLVAIVILAYPRFRFYSHNTFEQVHRFAGWTAVGLFWVQLFLLSRYMRTQLRPIPDLLPYVMNTAAFWLLLAVTFFLILPWTRLRKVDVEPEILSDHAIRLHFTYTDLQFCSGPRISDNPMKEWHAFAGIPHHEEDGPGFSMVVSNAGDWTRKIIRNPPNKLWVRGIPTKGVLSIAEIFKKVVFVATGSGIGPILSFITCRTTPCRILWSTPSPRRTYKDRICEDVNKADPYARVIDTTAQGRPNLIKLAYELYMESRAEAIFVISNPRVTRKLLYGLNGRGIPVFAPIFDS